MHKVLLITVTKVEAQTVLSVAAELSGQAWKRHYIGDKTYYYLGMIGGVEVFMVRSEMGTSGPGSAQLTAYKAIEALSPIAVIMVGIAFGVSPTKQKIGDILVSRQLQAYEPQKVTGQRRRVILPRGTGLRPQPVCWIDFETVNWIGPAHRSVMD